ncbi:MAG: DUF3081 family protein [Spongiibacteraceae bacterium]
MDKKFDVAQALRVIAKVVSKGEKKDDEYSLHGLCASEDFDGYRVYLHDDYVKLSVDFHNTYTLDFSNRAALELFLSKIHDIDTAE